MTVIGNIITTKAAKFLALFSIAWLAACEPIPTSSTNSGQSLDLSDPIPVALLVPSGSGNESDAFLATNLENAARLAIADLQGVEIDLRVYSTAANSEIAAQAAVQAVSDGAKVIIGPLYSEAANAAGVAVAPLNVNVLTFSNNTAIAGGNVFVLGSTFQNTANRLVSYAASQGVTNFVIVHGEDLPGSVGRDAITNAIRNQGSILSGVQSYPLSQQGILDQAPVMASVINTSGAQAVFMTGEIKRDLPIVATALPERGVDPTFVRSYGLTRWDVAPENLAIPGLQGGVFAMPDQTVSNGFQARYTATYGGTPHPIAGLAYDGIAAIGALAASGNAEALTTAGLTQPQGFQGTSGIFRLFADGTNERGLAVAQVQNNQVVILEPAPRSFAGVGF